MNPSYHKIRNILKRVIYLKLNPFRRYLFLHKIKNKKIINVTFLLTDVSKWKTEALYIKMKNHPRFNPILAITPTLYGENKNGTRMKQYLQNKNYAFLELSKDKTIIESTKADIIFYQEPYYNHYYPEHEYINNLKAASCYVNYAFHSIAKNSANNFIVLKYAFQVYYENMMAYEDIKKENPILAKNIVVTGLPITDMYLSYKKTSLNPWPKDNFNRKKIIWAPHHTLPNSQSFIKYSTFLDYYDIMLDLAEKYKDQVIFAFKPHPVLKTKLLDYWNKQEIEDYYHKWESMENTILSEGDYVSLFMNSDAMIHDCSSFQIEYHYTQNPVLYLCYDVQQHKANLNTFAKKAFDCHYIGKNRQDIENFIIDVIRNNDPMKDSRTKFFEDNLMLPYGKSASDNIINSILGNH